MQQETSGYTTIATRYKFMQESRQRRYLKAKEETPDAVHLFEAKALLERRK